MSVPAFLTALHPTMIDWRKTLHRHPELAFEEHKTAAFVANLLRQFGVDDVVEGVGGTGVVGIIREGEGKSVGLRADMDALPIRELVDRPHKSMCDGRMHACGHDGHTAMLLGAAHYLAETRSFRGTVSLIFQPAEEGKAGAKAMIDDGLFSRFPCDQLFALHNFPGMQEGTLAVSEGPVMASADRFRLVLTGKGAHAAAPHLSRDPVVASAALIGAIQTVVSRNCPPEETLVISVTEINGGDAFNVIPETVELAGTIRFFRQELGDFAHKRLKEIISGIATAYDVEAEFTFIPGYPPTVNWAESATLAACAARDIVGDAAVLPQRPAMFAEDFSFILREKPGAYAFLGVGNGSPDAQGAGLHSPHYDFNDAVLPIGASYLARVAERALA